VVLVGEGSAILAGLLASLLLASCLAGRSLRDAAGDVLGPWQQGDLPQARQRLARYVGRETAELDSPEILRAVLETVSENATDGVFAPLFYGLVGSLGDRQEPLASLLPTKPSVPWTPWWAIGDAPYTYLGWASARLEDGATWLPCRLTVATLALLSGHPRRVWRLCRRDAPADPSPNAGWSECAYAAALGVQLGGENRYRGQVKWKPLAGRSRSAHYPSGHCPSPPVHPLGLLPLVRARVRGAGTSLWPTLWVFCECWMKDSLGAAITAS
jgi:adenosylcobinamide-phosphate synthase